MFVLPSLHPSRRRHRPGWAVWQAVGVRRLLLPARAARIRRTLLAAALVAPVLLAGCTRGGSAATPAGSASPDAAATLAAAEKALNATPAMHFTITTPSTPGAAAVLAGASGDVVRPDRFSGALDVALGGQRLNVKVVSVAGSVWAQLFGAGWAKVDPGRFGVHDPGTLLAPQGGLADLLTAATGATFAGEKRRGAEVLRQVDAQIPGAAVAKVLTTTDPSKPVPAVFGIDEATGQLREATLTGPFFSKEQQSTYTVVLENYGEQVDISAPAG